MPPEDRVGCHDRRKLAEQPSADPLAFRRESSTLSIRQAKATSAELLLQDSVLFAKIVEHLLLLAAHPAREGGDEKDVRRKRSFHGARG